MGGADASVQAGRAERLFHQRKVKKSREGRTDGPLSASHFQMIWRHEMRTLSFVIALVSVLAGPSMAGSADRDMPGIGTFTYCGSPIVTPLPDVMAAVGQ